MDAQVASKFVNFRFDDHVHRFAIWTAARAVSRNFTHSNAVRNAIELTRLRDFVEERLILNSESWSLFHINTCEQIVSALSRSGAKNASYGRAAKIVAIYLKTAVIIPNRTNDSRLEIVHAPIDAILLATLYKAHNLSRLRTEKWTLFSKEDYWSLISFLEQLGLPINWRLEAYWNPTSQFDVE